MIMNIRGDKIMNIIGKVMPGGKWFIIFASLVICIGMGTTQALAITTWNNNFTMENAGGTSITGGMNDVVFTWDGTQRHSVAEKNQVSNVQFSEATEFFGFTWSTHDNVLYGPGTYTVYTACPGGSPGCGIVTPGYPPLTFTVGPDELGVHFQFNWNVSNDIDMVNVFKRRAVFSPSPICTNNPSLAHCNNQSSCNPATQPAGHPCLSPDIPSDKVWDLMSKDVDGNGINGLAFVDGPFIGFSGNMNVMLGPNGTPGLVPAHLLPEQCVYNICTNTNDCTVSETMVFGFLSSDMTLTISNNGDPGNDLVFPPNAVTQQPSGYFSIVTDNCSGHTLVSNQTTTNAQQTCTMIVHFASPGTPGNYTGSFLMQSNDAGSPTRINLTGGSSPPDKPVLVSPGNGLTGVGAEQEFRWMVTTDPEGHTIKYQAFVCTDPNFSDKDCKPAYVVGRNSKGVFYAGGAGLLMIGMTFIGGLTGRKRIVLLLIIVVLCAGGALISCHSKDVSETTPAPAGQVSYFAPGLSSGTTYYWKVVADNGQLTNNVSTSCVWSFTTK